MHRQPMARINYSRILTRLMDREFDSGWASANCVLHMAWRFCIARTDFSMFLYDDVEGIVAAYLEDIHVYVPTPGRIPNSMYWIQA